jgi:glutamine amidotransferase
LLLTNGEVMVATAWTHSLSVLRAGDAVVIASEPYNQEPGWLPVPERHAVRVEHGGFEFVEIQYSNEERSA